ncbi:hypothetical protein AB3S75_010698 [Citrus x aurantiifolia]
MNHDNDDDLSKELESLEAIYNQISSEVGLPNYMLELLGDDLSLPKTYEILNPLPRNGDNQNPRETINNSSDEGKKKKAKYDGRTHSLPHKKNGPYTCPKCNKAFAKSQIYAAHVSSGHYKFETPEQRAERLAARYPKRNTLQPVDTSEGLTMMPVSSSAKKKGKRSVKNEGDQEQKQRSKQPVKDEKQA